MDRRSFIKLTAVTGTTAALASCGDPDVPFIRFVPDEEIVPGQAVWKPAVCPLCAAGCGLTVRMMGADADVVRDGQAGVVRILAAKKLEGAPTDPIGRGGLCPRGQAAIQVTYHPDRITQPLKRTGNRGEGRYEAVSWDEAIADVVGKLNELAASGRTRALACLARPAGGHRTELISQFLARFGAPGPLTYELFGDEVLRRANAISFGRDQLPTFDLANTGYLLSFGADFLGTWNTPVAQSRAYGEMRDTGAGGRGRLVQVESRMSQTGANADEWVPVRPGTEGVLALGIAHVILRDGLRPAAGGERAASVIEGWSTGLPDHAPDRVEAVTGVPARRIERLARDFAGRGPALAIAGGAPLAHTNGLFNALAVNALNALAGSVAQPGGLFFMPQMNVAAAAGLTGGRPEPARPLDEVAAELLGAADPDVQVLFVDGVNPVFTAPPAWRVREAFERVPFIVSFGSFLDETAILADLILPDHSFLETWAEAMPESGSTMAVATVAPPAMAPLHQTRATPDVLLEIGGRLDRPIDLPWQTFEEMLGASFTALPESPEGFDAWTIAQETGGWSGRLPDGLDAAEPSTVRPRTARAGVTAPAVPVVSVEPRFDGDPEEYPLHLLPYASTQFLDGALAHLPWLQEMPDPMTSAMWSSWVEINPATAGRLGVAQGDVVEVASAHGSVRTAAFVSPAIAPDVVAMPAGQGHTSYTRVASGRGVNPVGLLAPMTEEATGALAWAATRVKVTRVGSGDGRLILFAGGMREHIEHGR